MIWVLLCVNIKAKNWYIITNAQKPQKTLRGKNEYDPLHEGGREKVAATFRIPPFQKRENEWWKKKRTQWYEWKAFEMMQTHKCNLYSLWIGCKCIFWNRHLAKVKEDSAKKCYMGRQTIDLYYAITLLCEIWDIKLTQSLLR